MRYSTHLLSAAILCILFSFAGRAQSKKEKYTDYDRGYRLWYYNKHDSAFLYFNRYLINPTDTIKKAKAYYYMADIQSSFGDLYGAQESLKNAVHTLDSLKQDHWEDLGTTYNVLGNVNKDMRLYDEAINSYNIAEKFTNADDMPEVINGKAIVFQKMGRYTEALALYDSIIKIKIINQERLARIIDNRAMTKWLQHSSSNVLHEFHAALKIRTDSQYAPGLNASYAHLADYHAKINRDSALWYARKMLKQATRNRSPGDILEAMDKLIELTNSAKLHREYKILADSLQLARDTSRNRFAAAGIKYNFQQTKIEILELKQQSTWYKLQISGIILLALILITAIYLLYIKRRNRIRQESEKAIRESRLKTSQKVHDVVANGLYGIMNELEHKTRIDKEPLINKIEELYEKSRNISHEDTFSENDKAYDTQIHELITAFSDDQTDVFIVGNQPRFWSDITDLQKQELQLVLKELLVNMKKHSNAKNVLIQFKKQDGLAHINYKDDGVGFPDSGTGSGKGLKNTVSRINSLHGDITFGKSEKGGATAAISFPLQS